MLLDLGREEGELGEKVVIPSQPDLQEKIYQQRYSFLHHVILSLPLKES